MELFNPQKIALIIFALVFIQAIGSLGMRFLNIHASAIFSGFLGGLISSTATTAALAHESKRSAHKNATPESLSFISSTLAMLLEGIFIVIIGTETSDLILLMIFLGPAFSAVLMMFFLSRNHTERPLKLQNVRLDLFTIFKLTAFIVAILALTKFLQGFLGKTSLFLFTFITSLFEIYGSFIANTQLHTTGAFDTQTLGSLIAISIAASYLSKLFLIYTLGSTEFKDSAKKFTIALFLSLLVSWCAFALIVF